LRLGDLLRCDAIHVAQQVLESNNEFVILENPLKFVSRDEALAG
jgi:hypothetical protein